MDPRTLDFYSLSTLEIDQFFGFKILEVEHNLLEEAQKLRPYGDLNNLGHVLHNGNQTWIGLEPDTLNTPYKELIEMCEIIDPIPGSKFVDLGAGYGKLGLVLHHLYPACYFQGFELVRERVEEGSRVLSINECKNSALLEADLTSSDFTLPEAQYYFLYDYGKVSHIRETLKELESLADTKNFKLIARGKGSRSIIHHEHPWLTQIHPPVHRENFSVYTF